MQNISELVSEWERIRDDALIKDCSFIDLGKQALEFGYPSIAYDILKEGSHRYPENTEISYHAALALARNGATSTARNVLKTLLESINKCNDRYGDLLSLAGRLAKDCWSNETDIERKRSFAAESMHYYLEAYNLNHHYYPGINAATMSLMAGYEDQACNLAREIKPECMKQAERGRDYWLFATLGEINLLLDRRKESLNFYRKAWELAQNHYGDIASIRRQLRYLSFHRQAARECIEMLPVPVVIAFTGHMIDKPDRCLPRFPASLESEVSTAIRQRLDSYTGIIAYSSAACGADILFLEIIQSRNFETHVVIPFRLSDFIETSIRFAGEVWLDRFNQVIRNATTVSYATNEGYLGDDLLFEYANSLIQGKALLKAENLESRAVMLAVAESTGNRAMGGTMANIDSWEKRRGELELIDLAVLRNAYGKGAVNTGLSESLPNGNQETGTETAIKRQVKSILFADCVGFSRLGEESAPSFFVNFLGNIAELITNSSNPPLFSNTWGDGLFLVFDEAHHAAAFAIELKEMVLTTNWSAKGLPAETSIRIAMHTGPVYCARDPIIGKENFYGTHVNLAARVEPVTAPGAVFLTEQSACILAGTDQEQFACDYLGLTELAKRYGSECLYRLRRRGDPD